MSGTKKKVIHILDIYKIEICDILKKRSNQKQNKKQETDTEHGNISKCSEVIVITFMHERKSKITKYRSLRKIQTVIFSILTSKHRYKQTHPKQLKFKQSRDVIFI